MKKLFFVVFILLFLTCCNKRNVGNDNSLLSSNPELESILEQSSSLSLPGAQSSIQDETEKDTSRAVLIEPLKPEEYAQLRAMIPYLGLSEVNLLGNEGFDYIIDPPGKRGKEFVELLSRVNFGSDIMEYDSPKDIPDSTLIYIGIRSIDYYNAREDEGFPLRAIEEAVGDYQFYIKEHIEAAIGEIFGEVSDITHGDVAYYRWYENEGVYTPPGIGCDWPLVAVILDSKEQNDRYILTVAYVYLPTDWNWTSDGWKEIINEMRETIPTEAQKYEVVLLKQPDGRVTLFSQHLL